MKNNNKVQVYSTYDTCFQTWNVMDMDNQCLFFGTIDELEEWLDSNQDRYEEQLH
jgi:hypothetical protein